MGDKNKTLKDYDNQLILFFIFNLTLFVVLVINKSINIEAFKGNYSGFAGKDSIIAGSLGTLIIFALNGVLPSTFKASIVFWRIKHPLPGCRIFTKIALKDCRVDFKVLESKYGVLPKEPLEQNNLWYKLSVKHKDDDMISKSHRDFLFSRDLTGLAFLFLIVYSIVAVIINKGIADIWFYLCILLFQYVILAIISQNYGKRFACNVLARESSIGL